MNLRKQNRLYDINRIALTAAIYVALCYILQPISFGPIQFRFSEMLCLLAIDFKWALYGVSIGCFLANTFFGGLGILDIVFGTSATIIGCSMAYFLRKKRIKDYPLLSTIMIILANAIIVGIELGIILETKDLIPLYIFQVGIGEAVVLFIGLPVYKRLEKLIKSRYEN